MRKKASASSYCISWPRSRYKHASRSLPEATCLIYGSRVPTSSCESRLFRILEQESWTCAKSARLLPNEARLPFQKRCNGPHCSSRGNEAHFFTKNSRVSKDIGASLPRLLQF